jgi:hypothetical protein
MATLTNIENITLSDERFYTCCILSTLLTTYPYKQITEKPTQYAVRSVIDGCLYGFCVDIFLPLKYRSTFVGILGLLTTCNFIARFFGYTWPFRKLKNE